MIRKVREGLWQVDMGPSLVRALRLETWPFQRTLKHKRTEVKLRFLFQDAALRHLIDRADAWDPKASDTSDYPSGISRTVAHFSKLAKRALGEETRETK